MRAAPLLLLALAGCAVREKAPDLEGRRHVTGLGFAFWWTEPSERYRAPAAAAVAIDAAFDEWAALHPERSRAELLAVTLPYRIQVVPGRHVHGDRWWRFYEGYAWYAPGLVIEFAADGEFYDKHFTKQDLKGARILLHEFEHALRGDFHPE